MPFSKTHSFVSVQFTDADFDNLFMKIIIVTIPTTFNFTHWKLYRLILLLSRNVYKNYNVFKCEVLETFYLLLFLVVLLPGLFYSGF